MRRRLLAIGASVVLVALVVAAALAAAKPITPKLLASSGTGRLEKWGSLDVVFVSGSPYERGFQHGALLKERVRLVADMVTEQAAIRGQMQVAAEALEEYLLPDETEEMRGLADGAGVSYDSVLYVNLAYEVLRLGGCSQFAAIDDKNTLMVGRNLDYGFTDVLSRCRVLIVAKPSAGEPYFAPGFAGQVGVSTGINGSGIYAAINAVPNAEQTENGVASGFAIRRLLTASHTMDEALNLLDSSPCAVGYNLMLVSGRERRFLVDEIGVTGSAQVLPKDGFVVTTNHYTLPEMISRVRTGYQDDARQETLEKALAVAAPADRYRAAELLKSVAVGPPRYRSHTLESLVWLPALDEAWLSLTGLPATSGSFALLHPMQMMDALGDR